MTGPYSADKTPACIPNQYIGPRFPGFIR